VTYLPAAEGRIDGELLGRVRGKARAVVAARGRVAFSSQPARFSLRRTPAAKRLVPGLRFVWFRVTFRGAADSNPLRYTIRIRLRR
jgi:hypothetical protein